MKEPVEVGQFRLCRITNVAYRIMQITEDGVYISFKNTQKDYDEQEFSFSISSIAEDSLLTPLMVELL